MKQKHVMFFVIGLLVVLAVPMTVMAQNPLDLSALARVYPSDAPFFLTVRTDDQFLDSIDAIIERANRATGEANPLPQGIRATLSALIGENIEGGTFDNVIRSWAGSRLAFGINDLTPLLDSDEANDGSAYLAAIEVVNADAARAFIEDVIVGQDDIAQTETIQEVDYTAYELQHEDGTLNYYVIYADVMFVSTSDAAVPLDGLPQETLLNNNANFNAVLSQLPNDAYNAVAYFDLPVLLETAVESEMGENLQGEFDPQAAEAAQSFLANTGVVAVGATTLNDRSLTLDIAQLSTNEAVPTSTAVDSNFARFIPAGTPLVIHGTNLAGGFMNLLDSVRSAAESADSSDFTPEQVDQAVNYIGLLIFSTLRLDLQEDILSWLTGDFALTLGLGETFPSTASDLMTSETSPLEFSLLIEAVDPEKAAGLVDGVRNLLESSGDESENLTFNDVTIGDVQALQLTIDSPDSPFDLVLLVAANADVFVFGTPRMVEAALNLTDTLADDPLYQEAWATVLPNAAQVWYLAGEPLMPLVDVIESVDDDDAAESAQQLERTLTLFHTASISTSVNENGTNITRLVMTLPE